MTLDGVVYPNALLACLQDQSQTGVLTTTARIDLLALENIQSIIEDEHKHANQQKGDHVSQRMIKIIHFPYLSDLRDEYR